VRRILRALREAPERSSAERRGEEGDALEEVESRRACGAKRPEAVTRAEHRGRAATRSTWRIRAWEPARPRRTDVSLGAKPANERLDGPHVDRSKEANEQQAPRPAVARWQNEPVQPVCCRRATANHARRVGRRLLYPKEAAALLASSVRSSGARSTPSRSYLYLRPGELRVLNLG